MDTRQRRLRTVETILSAAGISKSFGGVHALKGVDFELAAGEVHALVGENGAGKSTLIKIFSGALRPDSGRILYLGKEVEISAPRVAQEMGIATVYQEPLLYPELDVVENIFMGREITNRYGNIDYREELSRARTLFEMVGVDPNFLVEKVGRLSLGLNQLVLIAKALSYKSRVIIFDEPTAILTEQEARRLFEIIGRLKEQGVGIIYISHRLEEVFQIADRITVMRDGEIKGTFPAREVTRDRIVELMAGRSLRSSVRRARPAYGKPVLSVQGFTRRPQYFDVSFDLYPGEILGFFGLVGSGRTEVALGMIGIAPPREGSLLLDDRPVNIRAPFEALDLGIAYLPEDRKTQGLFNILSIRYNISVSVLGRLKRLGFLVDRDREAEICNRYSAELSIKLRNINNLVSSLSGGNQQKVVLARWLAGSPRVLILDEPTRGIDVASKEEIHNKIFDLASRGVAIMVISSELPEILKISDRIIVMHEGRMTGIFDRESATPEGVLRVAMGEAGTGIQNQG
ncbi:MAG TPA: sugar ABC transporter ATP-binding protein [Firmicutes bacterium]|nr:sugar ABC transporter ATP-binding protein [Bacillota bacterium]